MVHSLDVLLYEVIIRVCSDRPPTVGRVLVSLVLIRSSKLSLLGYSSWFHVSDSISYKTALTLLFGHVRFGSLFPIGNCCSFHLCGRNKFTKFVLMVYDSLFL